MSHDTPSIVRVAVPVFTTKSPTAMPEIDEMFVRFAAVLQP
jgi:hypothetical protein